MAVSGGGRGRLQREGGPREQGREENQSGAFFFFNNSLLASFFFQVSIQKLINY